MSRMCLIAVVAGLAAQAACTAVPPPEVDQSAARYAALRDACRQVITAIGLDTDLIDRHVIILEDIVDTGKTLSEFLPQLQHHHPASLKIAALLHKPEATVYPIKVDYLGFSIPNKFVLGYGLDYDGLGRNIKEIYQLVG